jgi:hypothetical protein
VSDAQKDDPAGSTAEDLQPWERNRKQRQAELDAANAHGEQLAQRYGYGDGRPRFGIVSHANLKAKWRLRRG